MTRTHLLAAGLLLALATAAPLAAQETHEIPETSAIRYALDRFFAAMAARDTARIAQLVTTAGWFAVVVVDADADSVAVHHQSLAQFMRGLGQPGPVMIERYWQPRIFVDGPFAVVWAPYDFSIGGEFSHCGTDVFTLARMSDGWRITGGSYTVQREGCEAVAP